MNILKVLCDKEIWSLDECFIHRFSPRGDVSRPVAKPNILK